MLFALAIAITGFVPTVNEPDKVLSIMLSFLAMEIIFIPLTFVTGFAHDIVMKSNTSQSEGAL